MARPIYIWSAVAATVLLDLFEVLVTVPRLYGMADGLLIFDMRAGGYSLGQAAQLLNALGPAGRAYMHPGTCRWIFCLRRSNVSPSYLWDFG